MEKLVYEEIKIGQKSGFSKIITKDMQDSFAALSGDVNPLHWDKRFAREKGYKEPVVYGMLVASLYSTLAGVYLPGENCFLYSVNSFFIKPVYVGDTLSVEGVVIEKADIFRRISIKASIRNQYNEKVSRAMIEAGVLA